MAKTLKITVTAKDIAQGSPYDMYSCPIALAVKRRFPSSCVAVAGWIEIDDVEIMHVPLEADKFMSRFDKGFLVKPLTFEAELV